MMNPPIIKDIEPKADILVIMDWEDDSPHDIDLWCNLKGDIGWAVSYNNPEMGLVHLDRDDRGLTDDIIVMDDGSLIINYRNNEVMSWRGLPQGTYHVNSFFYSRGQSISNGVINDDVVPGPAVITLQLIEINPEYRLLKEVEIVLYEVGEEKTAFSFTITKDGEITNINTNNVPFVGLYYQDRILNPSTQQ